MRNASLAVEAADLTVCFGKFTAVDHITFTVNQGEIFGFLGANGAGKTTTIRVLCGLLVPTAGRAMVAGLDCAREAQAVKTKVGYMSQRFTLYNDLTVEENIDFAGALRKLDPKRVQQHSQELFDFVEFNQPVKTLVKDLPGGIKQQLSLALALLHDPEIVFLDEPTAGVSPVVRARFWALIQRLAKSGRTIFVTTHYLDEAEYCGRIALMRDGKIIALDSPGRLKAQTFPEPLFEIEPEVGASREWIEQLHPDPSVARIQPYGRRYHVLVLDLSAWKKIIRGLPKTYQIRPMQPTLEDVFIRRVEGDPT
jgi:ABC-2 type transport system ATP-binding protein